MTNPTHPARIALTARSRLKDAKSVSCQLLAKAAADTGTGATALGRLTGYSQTVMRRLMDADEGRPVPLHMIWTAGKTGKELLRRSAALIGCTISEAAADHHSDNHIERLHALLTECGDVSRVYSEAMSDGHLSAAERADLVREIGEAKAALEGAEAALRAMPRIGSVG